MEALKNYEAFKAEMTALEEAQKLADEKEDNKEFERTSYAIVDLLEAHPAWGNKYTKEKSKE